MIVYNEDDARAFYDFRLRPDFVITRILRQTELPAVFFKAFNDTPGARSLLSRYPQARAIYAIRRPDHAASSFVREFGNPGATEWIRRWREAAAGRSGVIHSMCRGDDNAWAVARSYADEALQLLRGREKVAPDVAAAYYLWQHSFYEALDLGSVKHLRLYDYADLVARPAAVMNVISDWLGVSRIDTSGIVWHAGRSTDPETQASADLLQRCNDLYGRILERAQDGLTGV